MKKRHLLIITSIAFHLLACNQASEQKKEIKDEIKPETSKNESLFDKPDKLCSVLSKNGIGELKQWQNPFDMGWGSLTDYYPFGPNKDGIGMQNNIAYYIDGKEKSVDSIYIVLNINNPSDKKNALAFLSDITERTLSSIDFKIPAGLKEAIINTKPFDTNINEFNIYTKLEKSKIESWKVVIKK